jgi:uncharacterized protein YjdB
MSEARVWYKNPVITVPIIAALIAAIGGIIAATIDGNDDVELCTVQGVVTSADGIPVADAVVEINGLSSKTDVSGVYVIQGASVGKKTVIVRIPGQEPIKRPMEVPEGYENVVFDMALPSFPAPEPAPAPAPTPAPAPAPTLAPTPATKYTLTVSVDPTNSGTVVLSPSQPPDGYDARTEVKLTATSSDDEMYAFDHWNLDASGTTSTTEVIMDSDKSIAAIFIELRVDKVIISPVSLTLEKTETRQLGLKVLDTNGKEVTDREVFWDPSNPFVADVVGGLVTGHNMGTAQITATVDGVEGSVTVNVVKQSVYSVSLTRENITLEVDETEQLSATVLDRRGNEITDRSVTWDRNNRGVVDISQGGLVTAKSAGTAVITASLDGKSDTVAVTVTQSVGSVSISPRGGTIGVGEPIQLTATVRDSGGRVLTDRPVTWSYSNPGVVDLNTLTGLVTGGSEGTVTITASVEGAQDSVTVTVTVPHLPPVFNDPPNEFSPKIGSAGDIVAINGQHFDGPNLRVKFGVIVAEIIEATATQITVRVPSGITGGVKIFLQTDYGTDVSEEYYNIM